MIRAAITFRAKPGAHAAARDILAGYDPPRLECLARGPLRLFGASLLPLLAGRPDLDSDTGRRAFADRQLMDLITHREASLAAVVAGGSE